MCPKLNFERNIYCEPCDVYVNMPLSFHSNYYNEVKYTIWDFVAKYNARRSYSFRYTHLFALLIA